MVYFPGPDDTVRRGIEIHNWDLTGSMFDFKSEPKRAKVTVNCPPRLAKQIRLGELLRSEDEKARKDPFRVMTEEEENQSAYLSRLILF